MMTEDWDEDEPPSTTPSDDNNYTDSDFLADVIPMDYWKDLDGPFYSCITWSHVYDLTKTEPVHNGLAFRTPTFYSAPHPNNNTLNLSTDINNNKIGKFKLTLSNKALFEFKIHLSQSGIKGQADWYDDIEATLVEGDSIEIDIDGQRGLAEFNIIKNGQNYIDQRLVEEMNQTGQFGVYKNPQNYNFELNKEEFVRTYGVKWEDAHKDAQTQGKIEISIEVNGTYLPLPTQEGEVVEVEEVEEVVEGESSSDWTQDDSWTLLGALILGIITIYLIQLYDKGGVGVGE